MMNHYFQKSLLIVCLVVSLVGLLGQTLAIAGNDAEKKLKVLIVDGQNNHNVWPKSTHMMRDYLEESGRFEVDLYRTRFTSKGTRFGDDFKLDDGKEYKELKKPKTDEEFAPVFSDYDVVVSNFGHGAAPWPDKTKAAFEEYMKSGGGFVSVHAADNSFPDWEAYNRMIGLGGWGGRTEKDGPYVYFDQDEKLVRDTAKGKGGDHGRQHEFSIVVREPEHPIMAGMPTMFMHTKDELYQSLRGPAEDMTVLATAFADKKYKGTGRHEPVVMVIEYEKGRIFHTPLGHDDYSFESVALITLLQRGTEWAATGKVTLEVPDDFPNDEKSSNRKYEVKVPALAK
jgi:type 1 glutamine amidotransferase